jgi:regulatory protein
LRDPANGQPAASELRAYACRLLGRREYSVVELGQRLRQKRPEVEREAIDEILAALAAENLLSDRRFAESFTRAAVARLQGPLKIRAGLRARGIADELVGPALNAGCEDWTALAARWLDRQAGGALDFDSRTRYYRRLVSRGFTHDQSMDALKRAGRDAG